MKKAKLLFPIALILALGLRASAAEPIKLKAANYLPPTHKMSLLTGWFCDEVKKRTNGRVEINYYPGGSLLSPVKMYNGVVQGIADIGFTHTAYTRGRFPITETLDRALARPGDEVAEPGPHLHGLELPADDLVERRPHGPELAGDHLAQRQRPLLQPVVHLAVHLGVAEPARDLVEQVDLRDGAVEVDDEGALGHGVKANPATGPGAAPTTRRMTAREASSRASPS